MKIQQTISLIALFIVSSLPFSAFALSNSTNSAEYSTKIIQQQKQDTIIPKADTNSFLLQDTTIKTPTDSLNITIQDSTVILRKDKLANKKTGLADSIPRQIIDSTAVYFFTGFIENLALGKLQHIDTSLTNIQHSDPNFQKGNYFASLGNIGLSVKSLQFKPNIHEGFDYFNTPLELYTYQNKDVKYYRVWMPFTELYYVMGPQKENNLKVIHTQNIMPGLNFGLNFRFINSPGIYDHQASDNKNLYVTARYTTKNSRYGLVANYIHDKLIVEENGGIQNDSVFEYSLEVNRALIPVNLQNATNTYKKGSIFINQYFNLGNAPSITTDTLGIETEKGKFQIGRLTHSFFAERKKYFYAEADSVNTKYYSGFDELLSDSITFDSTSIFTIENELLWSNISYDEQPENKSVYVYFGIKHQYVEIADTLRKEIINQLIPKAGFSVFLLNSFRLNMDGFYVLGDKNKSDYTLKANINQYLGTVEKNYGLLTINARISKQSPKWFYNKYHGNYLRWENNFDAEKYLTLKAEYSYNDFNLEVSYNKIDNYIYMDETAHPAQTSETQSILSASLDYRLKYRDFHLDVNLIYQKSKSDSLLRLPELIGNASIYYMKSVFDGAAIIQPGIEVFYNTSYFADAYMPATRSFYLQNEKKIGNAIYTDFYFNIRINRATLFFKYQHFNAALTGYNYYSVPHYPMQDYAVRFGVIWKFYD